jgi:hypothetical protein
MVAYAPRLGKCPYMDPSPLSQVPVAMPGHNAHGHFRTRIPARVIFPASYRRARIVAYRFFSTGICEINEAASLCNTKRPTGLPTCSGGVKIRPVMRQIIALVLMFAVCLQTAPTLFAAAPQMPSECQTASEVHSDRSCCPGGVHTASCCLDACLMAASVSAPSLPLVWNGHSAFDPQFQDSAFSSRGDAPLIRPPIL